MGQDLLLTLERITKQNGYKLKVYSCQNLKGIEVKVTMSEKNPLIYAFMKHFTLERARLHSIPAGGM